MNPLTRQQGFIATCWSRGRCLYMKDFAVFHHMAQEKLGRPIQTLDFAQDEVWEELRQATAEEFKELIGTEDIDI